jgi:hypothetical protein
MLVFQQDQKRAAIRRRSAYSLQQRVSTIDNSQLGWR